MPIRRTSNQSSQDTGFYNPEVYSDVGGGLFTYDPDAVTYISAVEAADGQALESSVKDLYNAFIVGCKADGVWSDLKSACILGGARTLSGALVPLVGVAPSGFNFTSADYDRNSGLVGDALTKYLAVNRRNNDDPRDDQHMGVYISTPRASGSVYIGAEGFSNSGTNVLFVGGGRNRSSSVNLFGAGGGSGYYYGMSRSISTSYNVVTPTGTLLTITRSAQTPDSSQIFVYRRSNNSSPSYTDPRLLFYSVGTATDLLALHQRAQTLASGLGLI